MSQMNPIPLQSTQGTQLSVITAADANEQTVYGSAGAIIWGEIDNTNNPSYAVWAKFYDNATPTVGTTVPTMIVKCRAGTVTQFANGRKWDYATAITCACVKTGGTGGTTSPDNKVTIKVYVI